MEPDPDQSKSAAPAEQRTDLIEAGLQRQLVARRDLHPPAPGPVRIGREAGRDAQVAQRRTVGVAHELAIERRLGEVVADDQPSRLDVDGATGERLLGIEVRQMSGHVAAAAIDFLHFEHVVAHEVGAGVSPRALHHRDVQRKSAEPDPLLHVDVGLQVDAVGVVDPPSLAARHDRGGLGNIAKIQVDPLGEQVGAQAAPVAQQMFRLERVAADDGGGRLRRPPADGGCSSSNASPLATAGLTMATGVSAARAADGGCSGSNTSPLATAASTMATGVSAAGPADATVVPARIVPRTNVESNNRRHIGPLRCAGRTVRLRH